MSKERSAGGGAGYDCWTYCAERCTSSYLAITREILLKMRSTVKLIKAFEYVYIQNHFAHRVPLWGRRINAFVSGSA